MLQLPDPLALDPPSHKFPAPPLVGIGILDLFAPVTLNFLIRWPSYMNLTRIPWRYTGCANMNSQRHGFRKLLSDRHTYIHTSQQTRLKFDGRSWAHTNEIMLSRDVCISMQKIVDADRRRPKIFSIGIKPVMENKDEYKAAVVVAAVAVNL